MNIDLKRAQKILHVLHNKYAIQYDTHIGILLELEYYEWDDPYTHKNEMQKESGFYVHRTGKSIDSSYKGGTYKGMDISIPLLQMKKNDNSSETNSYLEGGILIRAILDGSTIVEGPCKVVDHICKGTGWTLAELEKNTQLIKLDPNMKKNIYNIPYVNSLHMDESNTLLPMYGARVGLTMKKANNDNMNLLASHISLPLRSCIYIPTKHKETLYCVDRSIYKSPLYSILDQKTKSKDKYMSEYNDGKGMKLTASMSQLQIAGYYSK